MTNREFLQGVVEAGISADLTAYAQAEIDKMDARNEKRRNTQTKAQKENEGFKSEILSAIGNGAVASEIAAKTGLSTQKVSALCSQMVAAGILSVEDFKVKGKGSVKRYTVAAE